MSDTGSADGIGITGAEELGDMLEDLAGRMADVSPLTVAMRAAFLEVEKNRFDQEGPGWAGLAPSTLAEKASLGQSEAILRATGALMASLTQADAKGSVFIPVFGGDETSLTFGTDLQPPKPGAGWEGTALAWFHQEPAPGSNSRGMPGRPVIDNDAGELTIPWQELLIEWLSTGEMTDISLDA